MSEEMVIIRRYNSELEANLARAELEAASVHCLILSDAGGGEAPHLQFANGVHLAVHRRDVEAAEGILSAEDIGRGR